MEKEKLFELFDADKTKLTPKPGTSEPTSEVSQKCGSECENTLDNFAETDMDKSGVWYHGNENLAGVVAAFRKFAAEKGYHVSAAVATTADGKEGILLTRLSEAEFKQTQE